VLDAHPCKKMNFSGGPKTGARPAVDSRRLELQDHISWSSTEECWNFLFRSYFISLIFDIFNTRLLTSIIANI
jgi:hypothetical protein